MKKMILILLLIALVLPAFADDAKVLPKGVLRTYVVPVYSFATQEFDENGDAVDLSFDTTAGPLNLKKATVYNLGAAIEYGVNDWISAAFQWTPGQTFITQFDADGGLLFATESEIEENGTAKGPAELFAGAKFQIVGPKAPVMNDMFRVAVAAGGMIPLAFQYAADEENDNFTATATGTPTETNLGVSKNAYGIGARFYADYVINEMFFFNLYSQYKYFFPVAKEKTTLFNYVDAGTASEVDYGYELTVEAEPHFNKMISEDVELGIGLPVTYVMTPNVKYDETEDPDTATSSLYIKPSLTAFFMGFPLPMEFKVGYEYPIMGTNVFARNNVVFQIKSYMKF